MPEQLHMSIINKLSKEKRDISLYHHRDKSAYIVSHNSKVEISMSAQEEGDFLHLSIVSGPGNMNLPCRISFPPWCNYSISGLGNGDVCRSSNETLITIPPGSPVWQLKLTLPAKSDLPEIADDKGFIIVGEFTDDRR